MKNLKLAPVSAVLLAQFVNADAGSVEAQHDARMCALFGAFLNSYQHGGVQLKNALAVVSQYTKADQLSDMVGTPGKVGVAAKRALKVMQAYTLGINTALDTVAPCKLLKVNGVKATAEQCAEYAERAAVIVGDLVTFAITPKEKTAEEVAAAEAKAAERKAAKEAAEKAAAKAAAAERRTAINEAVEKKVATLAPALAADDMAAALINAIKTGAVSADMLAQLSEALDSAATFVEETRVPVEETEAA